MSDCYDMTDDYLECVNNNGGSVYDVNSEIVNECVCRDGLDLVECTVNAFKNGGCLNELDVGQIQMSILDEIGCTETPRDVFVKLEAPYVPHETVFNAILHEEMLTVANQATT